GDPWSPTIVAEWVTYLSGLGISTISLSDTVGSASLPIIQQLAAKTTLPISIDTTKSEVAKQAIEAGASIVNDISALRFDPKMSEIIARYHVPVVLMHMQGTPKTMQQNPTYADVTEDVLCFFKRQINHALNAGISHAHIILDPGFGFGKRFEHNLQLLGQLCAFHTLNCPILVGPSRKQFTGPNEEPSKRVPGTIAAISQSILLGAHIVRVHDVWETRQATRLLDQTRLSMPPLNP
ncbi:MAG: dihydropteroate synthase, partial [Candidatus Latescibacteria bacterium]|nr:dihydropteroate synthase [Candidatus Latescibacterota bacterium]